METTVVQCRCGAEFKRVEPMCLMPHSGHVSCEVCGAVLESWAESTHVATFELVKRPDGKPAMTSHPKRPRDPNQLAKSIIDIATGQADPGDDAPESAYTKRARTAGRK